MILFNHKFIFTTRDAGIQLGASLTEFPLSKVVKTNATATATATTKLVNKLSTKYATDF